jgi:ketosteroid isomerase-like protein
MSRDNVDVVRALFDAYRRQAIDAAVDVTHPDIEVRPSIAGGPEGNIYRGRDGFRAFLADVEAAWADFSIEVDEYRDLGATVLVLGRSFARGGESGVALEAPTGWVVVVRDGKIHRFTSFASRDEALEAMGLQE